MNRPHILARTTSADRPRAFTIVEAAVSTVIVAIMLVAALTTVGASKTTQHRAALLCRGRLLAEALMTEILQQSYQEPRDAVAFGLETGESATIRATYDDVDDYRGWSASPPTAKDGTVLDNSTGWRRSVTVDRANPLDPAQTAAAETGAKRITVTAFYKNVPQATLVAVKTVDWE
jgi:type II secretory pathway pseudopilin PulG